MKKIHATLILSVIILTSCQSKPAPGADVKAVTIKYTEFGRETMFKITAESFDKYFPTPHVMNIISKPAIDTLMKVLGDMKAVDSDNHPDVRGKIYITHADNKVDTVCLGVTFLTYKQVTYETPQKLLLMIQQ